jgi:hypothetical protein
LGLSQFFLHGSKKCLNTGSFQELSVVVLFFLKETLPTLPSHGLHPRPFILPGKIGELTDGFRCHIGFYCEIGVGPY